MSDTGEPSLIQNRKKKVQLLAFNEQQKLCYIGSCKIRINALSRYLTIEPHEEDQKPIGASFDSKSIQLKNILFVNSGIEKDIQKLVLVFVNEIICEKVVSSLIRFKANIIHDNSVKVLHLETFAISVFNQINDLKFKQIMAEFIRFLNDEEKMKLTEILKKNNMDDAICNEMFLTSDSTGDNTVSHAKNNEEISIKRRKRKYQSTKSLSTPKQIIKKPKYELIEGNVNGKMRKRLIVFFDDDRKLCYEYYWNSEAKSYLCLGCIYRKKKSTRARLYNSGTVKEYIDLYTNEHICEPKEYTSVKIINARINIVKKPKYELIEAVSKAVLRKRMILHVDEDRKLCYDYIWRESEGRYQCCECKALNKYVHAILRNQNSENEYLELCARKHVCAPKESHTVKALKSNKIIKKPKYEISEGLSNGTAAKRLIVFLDDEKKMCYNYLFEKLNNCFKCIACLRLKKTIRAVLYNSGTENEYIDLFANEHICEPKEVQSLIVLKKSEIIKKPKYQLIETFSRRKLVKHLIVFADDDDKNDGDEKRRMCYDYYWDNAVKRYKCCGCKSLPEGGKSTIAAIFNLNTVNEYVELLGNKHFCEPKEFQTLAVLKKSERIKKPKYELIDFTSNNNVSKKRLIVFIDDEKKLCYDYCWDTIHHYFLCSACKTLKKSIGANIYNADSEDEYIELSGIKHVCQPRIYETLFIFKSYNIVTAPNFVIQKSDKNGYEKQNLYIFDAKNREMCHKYFYQKSQSSYYCCQCKIRNVHVSAKLCKNSEGEEYIKLGEAEHVCKLLPYDFVEEIIMDSSKFKIIPKYNDTNAIFVFTSEAKDSGYLFTPSGNINRYVCRPCFNLTKKTETVKLCKRETDGEYFIRIKSNFKHICEPKKYEPQKWSKTIVSSPNFIFYSTKSQPLTQLLIFANEEKKNCYDFLYSRRKTFSCKACAKKTKKKEYCSCLVRQDSEGHEFLELSDKEHICEPLNYANIKRITSFKILDSSGLEHKKKDSEGRIVSEENFEFQHNKYVPNSKLILFDSENRNLCYEFYYRKSENLYYCRKCERVTGKLDTDENGKKIFKLRDNLKHSCEILKYESQKSIIKQPNFIIYNQNSKNKVHKLIIFASEENRELCYEYNSRNERENLFVCVECLKCCGKKVSAKLITDSDGNEFIQPSTVDHFCKPIKFVLNSYEDI